jgi:glycosyltransferase involved in cell wall biosynthesis
MKTAIIYDWLVTVGGGEKVLEQVVRMFPHADLHSLVDFLPENKRDIILNKPVKTSFIQKLPFARKKYRNYLALMPLAVEQFDLSAYDLVISVSNAISKGVITGPDQTHISYVNSPIRYAWDMTHQYLNEAGLTHGPKSWLARLILHYIRNWDYRTASGVDYLIGNSNFIRRRINKVYRRDASVIYPPVDINAFALQTKKQNFYLTASRMVPYKKIGLIVKAFSKMPHRKLVVIGDGPDYKKISTGAPENITFLGYQSHKTLLKFMQKAKAFVFAAEEDFGIVPVEAQACGTPVIAFGKGGALETVVENKTGLFFKEQTTNSLIDAVNRFEDHTEFDPEVIRNNALRFSPDRFCQEFISFVKNALRSDNEDAVIPGVESIIEDINQELADTEGKREFVSEIT